MVGCDAFTNWLAPVDIFRSARLAGGIRPDQLGRYEWLFARLRQSLMPVQAQLHEVLVLRDTVRQSRLVSPETPLGRSLDTALDSIMGLDSLCRLFGPNATANRRQPFARHFAERIRQTLATLPAGQSVPVADVGRTVSRWLPVPCSRRRGSRRPMTFTNQSMERVLSRMRPNNTIWSIVSNILDWVTPRVAAQVLADAARTLHPHGLIVVRQLNSALDIRAIPAPVAWLTDLSTSLHASDRSFFYRDLHVGRRL
jgi:S-adenosylmethionine-diacylglycerol 3-amino-3-carboxypropyl transferase